MVPTSQVYCENKVWHAIPVGEILAHNKHLTW